MLDLFSLTDGLPRAGGYLLDLDGTLVFGQNLAPGARHLLERVAGRAVILSNDSEHVPEQLVRRFNRWGMRLEADHFVLAGAMAVDLLARREPRSRVMLVGSEALRRRAHHAGLVLTDRAPDIVLLARDRRFSYAKLANVARAVSEGARLILACPDRSHPGPSGEPRPEVGALAAAVFACVGEVEHEVIGKPEPHLFDQACARLGIASSEAVMIGDNPLTDGLGASRLGMPFLHVAPRFAAPETARQPAMAIAV